MSSCAEQSRLEIRQVTALRNVQLLGAVPVVVGAKEPQIGGPKVLQDRRLHEVEIAASEPLPWRPDPIGQPALLEAKGL